MTTRSSFAQSAGAAGRLCSVIFAIGHDEQGEYYRLVTAWKATKEEEQSYAENT